MTASDPAHHRPWRAIQRRVSRKIRVGDVEVGGDAPITVQSMTNTVTADAAATIAQVRALEEAGADIVRVSCPDEDSTAAFGAIAKAARVPLVADIHFHYKRGIEAAKAGAACLRINPGNIGSAARVREVIQAARDHGCSMRIGVNAGSLERDLLERYGEPCPEAMVESALNHARILQDHDFHEFKISVKATVMKMCEAFTRVVNWWKSWSCGMRAWRRALSTMASGQGSPNCSKRSRSSEPPLTPMRMEQPWSRAAWMTSRTRSGEPILPGLIRRQAAPALAASMPRL